MAPGAGLGPTSGVGIGIGIDPRVVLRASIYAMSKTQLLAAFDRWRRNRYLSVGEPPGDARGARRLRNGAASASGFLVAAPADDSLAGTLLAGIGEVAGLSRRDLAFAEVMIRCVDEDGYLDLGPLVRRGKQKDARFTVVTLAERLGVAIDPVRAEHVLARIRQLEPPGCAARDLRECLLAQVEHRVHQADPTDVRRLDELRIAAAVLTSEFDAVFGKSERRRLRVSSGKLPGVARRLSRGLRWVREAVALIQTLDARPGRRFETAASAVQPDLIVRKRHGRIVMEEPHDLPALGQIDAPPSGSADDDQADRREAARIEAFVAERRERTAALLKVLLELQPDVLDRGFEHMRPLLKEDVAQTMEVDHATVSRLSRLKYVQVEFGPLARLGVFPLGHFFSRPVRERAEVSRVAVIARMRTLVQTEDKAAPRSDRVLQALLVEELGIPILREVVGKCRRAAGIPSHTERLKVYQAAR